MTAVTLKPPQRPPFNIQDDSPPEDVRNSLLFDPEHASSINIRTDSPTTVGVKLRLQYIDDPREDAPKKVGAELKKLYGNDLDKIAKALKGLYPANPMLLGKAILGACQDCITSIINLLGKLHKKHPEYLGEVVRTIFHDDLDKIVEVLQEIYEDNIKSFGLAIRSAYPNNPEIVVKALNMSNFVFKSHDEITHTIINIFRDNSRYLAIALNAHLQNAPTKVTKILKGLFPKEIETLTLSLTSVYSNNPRQMATALFELYDGITPVIATALSNIYSNSPEQLGVALFGLYAGNPKEMDIALYANHPEEIGIALAIIYPNSPEMAAKAALSTFKLIHDETTKWKDFGIALRHTYPFDAGKTNQMLAICFPEFTEQNIITIVAEVYPDAPEKAVIFLLEMYTTSPKDVILYLSQIYPNLPKEVAQIAIQTFPGIENDTEVYDALISSYKKNPEQITKVLLVIHTDNLNKVMMTLFKIYADENSKLRDAVQHALPRQFKTNVETLKQKYPDKQQEVFYILKNLYHEQPILFGIALHRIDPQNDIDIFEHLLQAIPDSPNEFCEALIIIFTPQSHDPIFTVKICRFLYENLGAEKFGQLLYTYYSYFDNDFYWPVNSLLCYAKSGCREQAAAIFRYAYPAITNIFVSQTFPDQHYSYYYIDFVLFILFPDNDPNKIGQALHATCRDDHRTIICYCKQYKKNPNTLVNILRVAMPDVSKAKLKKLISIDDFIYDSSTEDKALMNESLALLS